MPSKKAWVGSSYKSSMSRNKTSAWRPGNRRRIRATIRNKYKYGVGTSMHYFGNSAQPLRKNVALRYAQTYQFTTGTAGVLSTTQFIRLNSLYDPDQTGGGHQPYLFDTWSALYTRYRVNACKIEILFNTAGSGADLCCASQISGSTEYLTLTGLGIDRACELPNVATQTLTSSGNARATKMSYYVKLHKIEGIKKSQYIGDLNYSATTGASPSNNLSLQVAVGSYSGTASEACSCQVLITYYATMYQPIVQAQS